MNKNIFEGHWNILKGQVKEKWGKLSDDQLTRIAGKRDQLLGEIQKTYGYTQERAEEELSRWEKEVEETHSTKPHH